MDEAQAAAALKLKSLLLAYHDLDRRYRDVNALVGELSKSLLEIRQEIGEINSTLGIRHVVIGDHTYQIYKLSGLNVVSVSVEKVLHL